MKYKAIFFGRARLDRRSRAENEGLRAIASERLKASLSARKIEAISLGTLLSGRSGHGRESALQGLRTPKATAL